MNCNPIHASLLLLSAIVFVAAPRSMGYTNPIEGGTTVTVTNTWTVGGGDLYIGQTTSDNTLIINNGRVQSTHGFIGSYTGANSNSVTGDSTWYNSEALYLGGRREGANWVDGGSGNRLDVFGGQVLVGEMNPNIDYPRFADIVVGDASGTPEMVIANGSSVHSDDKCYVGFGANESGSVEIRGAGSVWEAGYLGGEDRPLYIGYYGSGNRLTVFDGGLLDAPGVLIGYESDSDNNLVRVTGQGSSWNGDGFDVGHYGSGNRVEISDGGLVTSLGGGVLGRMAGSDNNSVLVTGAGSSWSLPYFTPFQGIIVGEYGKRNTLTVSAGGEIQASGRPISVGRDSGSDSNAVIVAGNGSALYSSLFYLGGEWNVGGRGNALYVDDGGFVSVGEDMYNRNYSLVSVDGASSHIVIGGFDAPVEFPVTYYQDATSTLRLGIETNRADAPLQVGGIAEFEAGATLQYHGAMAGMLDFDHFSTNLLVEADTLIVAGITNAHDLGAIEVVNLDSSLVEMVLWEQDQDILGLLSRRHLAESAGFAPGSQMALLSDELDGLSVQGNVGAAEQINLLNRMSGAQQNQQLTQLYERGTPNHAHIQGMTEGMDQITKHTSRHQPVASPEGAAGPHRADQGARGWIKTYGAWADRSAQGGFSGYDHNIHGTVVGVDCREGNALIGVAGGYARSDIRQDDGDTSKAETGYGVLYASWGTEDWFGDVNMAYGRSDIEQSSGTAFGNTADFDASNYALYLGGGKEIKLNDGRFLLTPQASMLLSYYYQQGYTEESDYLPREVDAYDRSSVRSSIGASLAYQIESDTTVIKPEARLFWLHEFNADSDSIDYTLPGGAGQYHYFMPAALEDVIEAGVGISCTFNDELSLVLDVDGRVGEGYSAYAVSGRIVHEF